MKTKFRSIISAVKMLWILRGKMYNAYVTEYNGNVTKELCMNKYEYARYLVKHNYRFEFL